MSIEWIERLISALVRPNPIVGSTYERNGYTMRVVRVDSFGDLEGVVQTCITAVIVHRTFPGIDAGAPVVHVDINEWPIAFHEIRTSVMTKP